MEEPPPPEVVVEPAVAEEVKAEEAVAPPAAAAAAAVVLGPRMRKRVVDSDFLHTYDDEMYDSEDSLSDEPARGGKRRAGGGFTPAQRAKRVRWPRSRRLSQPRHVARQRNDAAHCGHGRATAQTLCADAKRAALAPCADEARDAGAVARGGGGARRGL
jgi:hypothetical protein